MPARRSQAMKERAGRCVRCSLGQYTNWSTLNPEECSECRPGKYADQQDTSECKNCLKGKCCSFVLANRLSFSCFYTGYSCRELLVELLPASLYRVNLHIIVRFVTRANAFQGLVPVLGPATAKCVQSADMPQLTEISVSYVPTDVSRIKSPQLSARFAQKVAGRTKRQAQWMHARRAESGTPRENITTLELTTMEQNFPNMVALHALQVGGFSRASRNVFTGQQESVLSAHELTVGTNIT